MNPSELTIAEKLLLAALSLRERNKTFSAEDLVVEAWKMYPDSFGLTGYSEKYPDSNRIFTNIMGTKGMRGKGWLRKVGEKQYRLTSKGLNDGANLISQKFVNQKKEGEHLRSELDRQVASALERLINTRASRKALGQLSDELTFNDACGFWDITARSNANTLTARLSEVSVLLDRAKQILQSSCNSEGFKLPHISISYSDLEKIINLNSEMQEMFKSELNFLRRRTDERVEKKRRNL